MATMTLREAYERHYFRDELSANSIKRFRHLLTAWEKLTDDPDVHQIDDATMEAFRTAALKRYKPHTVLSIWQMVRSILRRIGPRETGNPAGLNILPSIPYMRPLRLSWTKPRRIPLDDISRVYVRCRTLTHPRRPNCSPVEWWRAWLVLAFCTGFRKCDLFNLKWEDYDPDEQVFHFQSIKTGKQDDFPVHPAAAAHLARIRGFGDGFIFRSAHRSRSGSFYAVLRDLCEGAEVKPFTPHDLRRTAASEIERVRPGMAATFLQHSPRDVTDRSYVNRSLELRDAIWSMRLPVGFSAGPKSAVREERKRRDSAVQIRLDELTPPSGPVPSDWKFRHGQFAYRGQWFAMHSPLRLAILRLLVTTDGPVHFNEIEALCRQQGAKIVNSRWVHVRVSQVRMRLRKCLGLGNLDPVPCVSRGDGGAWTVAIPE